MADQYYRFFPGDYQRDTGDLTLVEHGAYRVLLDHYYTCGPLPSEMDRLYRICRAFSTEEQTAVSTVVERFFQPNGNRLRNRKADKELSEREAFIEMQREKGRKSAEVRAERKKEQEDDSTVAITDVPTTVQPELQPEGNLPSPSPSPLPIKNKKSRGKENRFSPPSLDDVRKYCSERKNRVNPEKWFDFYQAKNWMIGKNKMKDWKAAVRTWEQREENNGTRWTGNAKSDTGGINRETADEIERLNEQWRKLHPVSAAGNSR